MKYRRLKTLDSTGVPILRYFKLADAIAYCNAFYKIADGEATKIEGEVSGAALVGFSHGGNNLAKGLILLDVNETPLYMALLEDGDTQPAIGDLVNGYQRVIDTHYEEESEEGKNGKGFGVEYLDVPYYIFKIEQPAATSTQTLDDSEAGEVSGVNEQDGGNVPNPEHDDIDPDVVWDGTFDVNVTPNAGTAIFKLYTFENPTPDEREVTAPDFLTLVSGVTTSDPDETFALAPVCGYTKVEVWDDTGTNLVVDISDWRVGYKNQNIIVAVPTIQPDPVLPEPSNP